MKRLAVLTLALIVTPAGWTGPATAQPALQAAATSYVALGDSYSSGLGTRSYLADGTDCKRSARAYPSLLAAQRGYQLNFRACSGAKIPDVTNAQLSALGAGTGLVTISVGGNDAGFAGVLTECAKPAWASDCNAAIDRAQAYIADTLPGGLRTLYGRISSRAPNASVVVVGYPRIFMGEDCNGGTWFSPQEQARLNTTADQLNRRLATAASNARFGFANPTAAFTGHAVCDNPEWINGLSNPVDESYHPNVAGHRDGYTPLVAARTGAAFTVGAETLAAADEAAADQAGLQARYAEADAGIEREVVSAPDLGSVHIRSAARAAGVDVSDPGSVASAERRYADRQARAWRTQR